MTDKVVEFSENTPKSEMPNPAFHKIVRAACQQLNKKPAPPH
jgi:hypothetical protein